jgi:ribosomal protein S18 acetylase RimI-like enzyme
MIIPLQKQHAEQVAQLHIAGIPTGFISSLGPKFVTALYESVAESPYGFGFVEETDGRVGGFVVFTTNIKGLYKTICLKKGLRFFFLLFSKLISPKNIKKIVETLLYPNRSEAKELPGAELLSIAVHESERGKGIAGKLIRRGLCECHHAGIESVKVLVADFNAPANKLYQKNGFQLAARLENHGVISNIYVAATSPFSGSE